MDHKENKILVVGASGGIGSALCRLLKAQGATLHLAGRDEEKLKDVAGEVEGKAHAVDACDSVAFLELCKDIGKKDGTLDGIVNCAGSLLLKPAHLTSQEEWNTTLSQNLGTAFSVVHAAGRVMAKSGGAVVLVSSAAAQKGLPNHEAIAAAKAGIEGLMRSAAATYARRGIRFNAVAPGLVRTPLTHSMLSKQSSEERSKSMHPLGEIGRPEDVARAIAWLLSPEQSWVTGTTIGVDGGLSSLQSQV